MKTIKIATLILFVLIVGGVLWYVFRPAPVSVAAKKVDVAVQDIPRFLAEFEVDEELANSLYLNKIIEVQGIVADLDGEHHSLTLQGNDYSSISCNFQEKYKIPDIEVGQVVKVKGRCAGYLLDVLLMECAIEENGRY